MGGLVEFYSASSLNSLCGEMGCARQWEYRKRWKFPSWGNASMERGTLVHQFIQGMLMDPEMTWDFCLDMYLEKTCKMRERDPDDFKDEDEMLERAKTVAEMYLEQIGPTIVVQSIEKNVLYGDIQGYIDIIAIEKSTGEEIIIDLKTTKRKPSSLSKGHVIQGAIYALAEENNNVRFDYLIMTKKPSILSINLDDPMSQYNRATIDGYMAQATAFEKAEYWPFRQSFNCKKCAYKHRCDGGRLYDTSPEKEIK